MSKDLLKLTGLWSSTDKNGNTILTGSLNAISRMVIMPNTFKTNDNDTAPDYYVYISQSEKPVKRALDDTKIKKNSKTLKKVSGL